MAQIIIPGTVQVTLTGQCGGQDIVNVLGFNYDGPADVLADQLATVMNSASGPIKSWQSTQYNLINIRITYLGSADGLIYDRAVNIVGGRVGSLSTNGACALIKLSSGTRNRKRNGRIYWGPLMEGDIDQNGRTVANLTRTGLETSWQYVRSQMATINAYLCVISRVSQSTSQPQAISCESIIATQRRRIRG